MASPFANCHLQNFQPCTLNSPLFINLPSRSNNGGIQFQPGKLPDLVTLSLSATANNPSENTLNQHHNLDVEQISKNLDFEDRTNRFRIKGLVHRIKALSSSNRAEILQILEKDADFQTITDFNHLLMALIIAKELDLCLRLFTNLSSYQIVPDCRTYSIMIRCHCERNDLDQAKRAFDAILENGFQPTAATVTVLINSLCKRGKLQEALEVFELMGKIGCNPTVQTHNCLLKGLCYVGKVEEALEMMMGMKKTAILKPDVYSYTAVMDGLCKVGRTDEAMELLNEAVEMGLVPNVVLFNTVLQGYSKEGRPLEGLSVLKLMKKSGCVPDYISYSTLLHGLLKWNEIRGAVRIYKEMVRFGFEVDERMMGTLVRRLCWESRKERSLLEDADEVFEKLKKRDSNSMIDQRTGEVMIQALCGVGGAKKVDKALANLNYMVRLGYSPGTVTFDKVIHGLCVQGRPQEALSTLLLWFASGGIPKRISYDLLLKELNAQGRLFCASYLFGVALKQGVVPIREPLICKSSR